MRAWDARHRSTTFVPATETVQIDQRRHPLLLVPPALRTAAGLLAAGSLVGGAVSSRYGRTLPEPVLRTAIVLLGLIAIGVLLNR